jgi:hypothetical protein
MFEANQIIVREDHDYPEGALVVHGYAEDGSLLAFPRGGGVQYRIPADELGRFEVVSDEEKVRVFEKARFTLEGLDDQSFEGWSDGSLWNGFEKPLFELDDACLVLEALGVDCSHDPSRLLLRAFIDQGEGLEEVSWAAEKIEAADGGFVEVFGVGAGAWMWDQA